MPRCFSVLHIHYLTLILAERLKIFDASVGVNRKSFRFGVWEYVSCGYIKLTNNAVDQALTNAQKNQLKEHRNKDAKTLHLIQNALDDTIFPKISVMEFSTTTCDIFETNYQGITKVKTVKLQNLRDFGSL